jgi:hypothetical protein
VSPCALLVSSLNVFRHGNECGGAGRWWTSCSKKHSCTNSSVVEWAYKADQSDAGRVKGVDVERGADQVKCVREPPVEDIVFRSCAIGAVRWEICSFVKVSSESEKAVDIWSFVMRAAEGPRSSTRLAISAAVEILWMEMLVSRISLAVGVCVVIFGVYGTRKGLDK